MALNDKAKTIDEYLSKLPSNVGTGLEKLRQIIKQVVPAAEEVISYGMPAFKYHGILLYFAAFKNHCSLFPGSSTLTKLKNELRPYQTSKGTLQFTFDKPLPTSLVKRIVKARMEENEARHLAKTVKKKSAAKKKPVKLTNNISADASMITLKHPLKKEIEAVRKISKSADQKFKKS